MVVLLNQMVKKALSHDGKEVFIPILNDTYSWISTYWKKPLLSEFFKM